MDINLHIIASFSMFLDHQEISVYWLQMFLPKVYVNIFGLFLLGYTRFTVNVWFFLFLEKDFSRGLNSVLHLLACGFWQNFLVLRQALLSEVFLIYPFCLLLPLIPLWRFCACSVLGCRGLPLPVRPCSFINLNTVYSTFLNSFMSEHLYLAA